MIKVKFSYLNRIKDQFQDYIELVSEDEFDSIEAMEENDFELVKEFIAGSTDLIGEFYSVEYWSPVFVITGFDRNSLPVFDCQVEYELIQYKGIWIMELDECNTTGFELMDITRKFGKFKPLGKWPEVQYTLDFNDCENPSGKDI